MTPAGLTTVLGLLVGGGCALVGGFLAMLLVDRLDRRPPRRHPVDDRPVFNPQDFLKR